MRVDEYLSQGEYYFSESAKQMIPLTQMPFPQLFNSYMKMMREHREDFAPSNLARAMQAHLTPAPFEIRYQLLKYGKAMHLCSRASVGAVRTKVRRAAKNKVTTKVTWKGEVGWVTVEIAIGGFSVKVKEKS